MKNKKLLAILLAVFSSFAVATTTLTACGGDDDNTEQSGEQTGDNTGDNTGDGETEHTHSYGAWEVTKIPTETETGTASRSCVDGDDTQTVTLPSLSDTSYTISDITATETEDGTAKYTITINGVEYSFTVSVSATGSGETPEEATVTAVIVTGDSSSSMQGVELNLTATVTMSDGSTYDGEITWSSSDETVATVSNGVVTCVGGGTATITATAGGVSGSFEIFVKADVEEEATVVAVNVSSDSATVTEGETLNLTASVEMSDGSAYDGEIVWASSDETIATVSNGVVTAVAAGTVTITATADGVASSAYSITVNEAVKVTNVEITGDSSEVTEGETLTLTATVTMSDGSSYDGDITWETSDVGVATVSDGVVTGVAAGTVTVTATAGGVKGTYEITVNEAAPEYEEVTTYADIVSAIASAGTSTKTTEDLTIGKFTFSTGLYFEASQTTLPADEGNTTYGVVNNQQKAIYFTVSGTTNSVSFDMRGASGSGCVMTLYKADGTVVYTWDSLANSTVMSDCVVSDLEAGTYYLQSVGSARIANLAVTEMLEVSDTAGISATAGSVDFLVNRTVSASDLALSVTLNYENGRKDSITSGYTTDIATAVDTTKSGTYTVTITYGEYTAEVNVNIYEIDSITLSDHVLNSSRETISLQKVYLLNASSLNTAGLAVTATAKCGTLEEEFVLTTSEYTISSPDLTTAGTQTVTVTASEKQASYEINVLSLSENVDKTTVNVDASATTVGEDSTSHIVTVKTINDALKLFELYGVKDSETKTINVAAGTYNEKVYIDMPNVTLVGANTGLNTNETVIVYDAMNGVTDPSGTTSYSTDGSATVTISANATNFTAKNITFKNYYNTHALYQEALTITSGTQAVACLVRGDMAYFENVTFTSYHDTLYVYEGRQVYSNCYIEGRTDYIFGDDATAYFYKCTIHSIGAGTSEKNGGYVVATKGGTSSAHVTYGYIFNECTFEGDENVQAGSVSVARGWDSYMTIMVMNSTFDESFSLEGYGYTTSSLNDRYTKMNAEPVASQLYEYNNTGVGAITVQEVEGTYTVGTYDSDGNFKALEGYVIGTLADGTFTASTDGTGIVYQTVADDDGVVTYYALFTVLSAEDIAKYSDYSVIFAATNGGVTYSSDWAGSNESYTISIYYGDSELTTINVYSGSTLSAEEIEKAVNAELDSQYVVDIIYTDEACTTVYTDGTVSGAFTLYITTRAADLTITESVTYSVSDFSEVTTGTGYIDKLEIDCGESGSFVEHNSSYYKILGDASITLTLNAGSSVTVSMYGQTLAVNGTDIAADDYVDLGSSNYSYTYTATTDGEEVVLSMISGGTQLYISSIAVNVPIVYTETTTINLVDDTVSTIQNGGTMTYKGIYIDTGTSGKYGYNNSSWMQVNAGTTLTLNVAEGSTVSVECYNDNTDNAYYTVSVEGTVATITVTANTYFSSITVTVPTSDTGDSGEETQSTTYTVTYIPTAAATLTASYTGTEDTNSSIKVESSGSNGTDYSESRSYTANGVNYTTCTQIKAYSARSVTITIPENATNVTITLVGESTSSGRYMVLASATGVTADTDTACLAMSDGSKSGFTISAENVASGEYYVYTTDGNNVYLYAVIITYTIAE